MKKFLLTLTLLSIGAAAQAQSAAPTQPSTPVPAPAVTATSVTAASKVYPSGYTFRQMLDALGALRGVSLRGVGFDERGYLNLTPADDAARQQAIAQVAAAGLPTGVLAFGGVPYTDNLAGTGSATATVTESPSAPTSSSLPRDGKALAQAHRTELSGPSTIRAGEASLWSFRLGNAGSAAINLQHGACDVRFEVVNAAGEVVRPDPKTAICTMQLVYTNVAPGETQEVQKIRWEGKDAAGQTVPAGQYTIRAVFRGAGVLSDVAEFSVTVQ